MTALAATATESAPVPVAGPVLWPEPSWVKQAADEQGWAWVRTSWARAAATPGAWFDTAKADAVIRIWPQIFRLTEDRFAGQPFYLTLWQEVTIRLLVGWKVPTEVLDPRTRKIKFEQVRLFRRLMLWIPRKNGKSEFLAALALMFYAIEGTQGGQGFVFARDVKQGRVVLDKMKAMVGLNPSLARRVICFRQSLWMSGPRAGFELLSGKPEGKHGRSPTVIVGDEMHEWPSQELATTLRQGTGARLQPIELYASTAGLKSAVTGYGLFDESQKILDGPIAPPAAGGDHGTGIYDPRTLVVMFASGDDDDWHDEATWRRVNPNVGLSPSIDFLRGEYAKARDTPTAESSFRRYHLNQWVESATRWISLKKWDACIKDKTSWQRMGDELQGKACFGGFDLSSTRDITALIWWFLPEVEGGPVRLVSQFWIPEENIDLRARRDRVPYDRWHKMGALIATPGDYVDQAYVQSAIQAGLEKYDVRNVGFDSWNATKLYTDMCAEGMDAARFTVVRQGIRSMHEASRDFERLVNNGLLDHGGHPVLRWMAGNALVEFDRNMNFRPAKDKSREKIDGIVAAVTANAVALKGGEMVSIDKFIAKPVMVI